MANKQNKIIKQVFALTVSTAATTVKGSFEVDKNAEKIIGVQISSDREDIAYYRGTQIIKINDEEFFPEGFESKHLMCGINVNPNQRYFRLGKINPGNRKVELIYTDSGNDAVAAFDTHKIYLYVYSVLTPQTTE
jgi:hypothetical protein